MFRGTAHDGPLLSGSRSGLATQQLQKTGFTWRWPTFAGISGPANRGICLRSIPQPLSQGHVPATAVTLVADCLGDEAVAVTPDPVGSRSPVRLHAAINPRRSSYPLARH